MRSHEDIEQRGRVPGEGPSSEAPNFSCHGVPIEPGTDIQSMVDQYPEGTTFCIEAGVHELSTGVFVKSNDRFIGDAGAILDGQGSATMGLWGWGTETGQRGVTVQGLVFRNFTDKAIKPGWDWLIAGNEFTSSGTGVIVNTGVVVRDNYIHHNAHWGVNGGPASNILIQDNEIAYNNTSNSCDGTCEGSASKIVGSTAGTFNLTWSGNWVHHNTGNGIWSDGNVRYVVYTGNVVEENTGVGIFHEISWDGNISNNIVRNNDQDYIGQSCWWGSQIHVNNSQNVRIFGNTVSSSAGANGICLVDAIRDEQAPFPTYLANIHVRRNVVTMTGSAMTGLVGQAARTIGFNRNTYVVPDLGAEYWAWYDEYPLDWGEFQARGLEANGSARESH